MKSSRSAGEQGLIVRLCVCSTGIFDRAFIISASMLLIASHFQTSRQGFSDLLVYLALFATALLAATIVPAQSEAALAALLVAGQKPAWALLAVASIGNVLGSTINWFLGRGIETFRHAKWFPASEAQLARAQAWYARYGKWSLLASWVPIIGDPLTVAAGLMREPLPIFLLLVTIAKVGRYLVLAAIVTGFWG